MSQHEMRSELQTLLRNLCATRSTRKHDPCYHGTEFARDENRSTWLRILELCAMLNIDVNAVLAA